jgi:hypothetical protein
VNAAPSNNLTTITTIIDIDGQLSYFGRSCKDVVVASIISLKTSIPAALTPWEMRPTMSTAMLWPHGKMMEPVTNQTKVQ